MGKANISDGYIFHHDSTQDFHCGFGLINIPPNIFSRWAPKATDAHPPPTTESQKYGGPIIYLINLSYVVSQGFVPKRYDT